MTKFLHHESCPRCGSKDNLGVWEDGHKWCFGCKYYEQRELSLHNVHAIPNQNTVNPRNFPEDAEYYIPTEPMKWLLKNGITYSSQKQYGIQWSPKQQLLCWKINDNCWQGRCFSPEAKTKYISQGKLHEFCHILGNGNNIVVLVEDYISALRVSEHLPCMPLFGCTINLERLQELLGRFNTLIVWLDYDKLNNARSIASNASLIGFKNAWTIYTKEDPKELTFKEIEQKLCSIINFKEI
jgi:hypothetical protein